MGTWTNLQTFVSYRSGLTHWFPWLFSHPVDFYPTGEQSSASPGAHGLHPLQLSGALPPYEAPISGFSFPKSSCLTCNTWFFNSVSSQSCAVLHLCDWAWKLPSGHQDGSGGYLIHFPSYRDHSAELLWSSVCKQLFNIFCPMFHCLQQGERESFYRR